MPRVVCQVISRPDRMTLIWSEGSACFSPYCIEGTALAELRRQGSEAFAQLGRLGAAPDDASVCADAGAKLAQAGHALYRLIFQVEHAESAAGQDVRTWLEGLIRDNALEGLEIVGDALSLPWNILCDRVPEAAAFSTPNGEGWNCFWGRRFAVLGGRRVQWLRGRHLPENPSVALALDPVTKAKLPEAERKALDEFLSSHDVPVAESAARLAAVFQSQEVDVLFVLGRASENGIRIGKDTITSEALERIVYGTGADEGPSGQTIVLLNACADEGSARPLTSFERFSGFGLVGVSAPLATSLAAGCGIELLTQLVDGGYTLSEALKNLRSRHPIAGLLYFASCPGDVRASTQAENIKGEEAPALPNEPYQPLTPLFEDSAALLVGRDFEAAHVASLLDENATRLVAIHGGIGVGKTSLVHAGVVPYLEARGIGFRIMRQRAEGEPREDETEYPVLAIRATNDLIGQLAVALVDFCSIPFVYRTPTGARISVDLPAILAAEVLTDEGALSAEDLRRALKRQPEMLGRILTVITEQLPIELVIWIDQGEELFSLADSPEKQRRTQSALAMLRTGLSSSARARFLVTLRSEYAAALLDELGSSESQGAVRSMQLSPLDEEDLTEVILQPTSQEPLKGVGEAPHEQYRFQFEQGVAEHIAAEAMRVGRVNQEAPLALVQVICSRLYEEVRGRQDRVVRVADLKAIGGVEKGIGKYIDAAIGKIVSRGNRKPMRNLLSRFVSRQPDGGVAGKLVFLEDLGADWKGSASLDSVVTVASSARLLDVNYLNIRGRDGDYASLASEVMTPVVAKQADEAAKRSHGWKKFGDALWISLPFLVLLAVYSWAQIRTYRGEVTALKESNLKYENDMHLASEQNRAKFWPAYRAQLFIAEQAIQSGNIISARQALLSLKPWAEREVDYRGFDWFYLWRQMNLEHATLNGHRGTVTALALSSDGRTLISTSDDCSVRLWDPLAPREVARVDLKESGKNASTPGRCIALSPDATMLVVGGEDGAMRFIKVNRSGLGPSGIGALLAGMPPHDLGFIWSVVQYAWTGNVAGSMTLLAELTEHKASITAVAFSPDGKSVASAAPSAQKDSAIKIWDAASTPPTVSATYTGHEGDITALAYSPDGKWLASGGDKKVTIWDAKGEKKTTLDVPATTITALLWSPDGASLVVAGERTAIPIAVGYLGFWEVDSWKQRTTPTIPVPPVFGLAFADDGKTLVTASKTNLVQLWDVATGIEKANFFGHHGWVSSVAAPKSGDLIVSGSFDGTIKVWTPAEAARRDLIQASSQPINAVDFSHDDRWLATGGADGVIKVWDTSTGEDTLTASGVKLLKGHKDAVTALSWNPEAKLLASAGADGKLLLWDMDPAKKFGEVLQTLDAHEKPVSCLQWSASGKWLASGGLDGFAQMWELKDGKLEKHTSRVAAKQEVITLWYDSEEDLLLTGHPDGAVRIWNAETGRPIVISKTEPIYEAHPSAVTGLALLHMSLNEGKMLRILTAGEDRSVKSWDNTGGRDNQILRAHASAISCMALGPRPELSMVTGGHDENVTIWDPELMQKRWTFSPGVGVIRAVAVSHDGRTIAAAGQSGAVRLYRAAKNDPKGK